MKRLLALSLIIPAFVLTLLAAETDASSKKSGQSLQEKPAMMPGQSQRSLSGRVVETMNGGGYTYVKIEKDKVETWLAVPQMKVTVGEERAFYHGATMRNFTSKSLDRTFDTIIFSRGIIGQQGNEMPGTTTKLKKSSSPEAAAVRVEKATGPDAYTVAELYEKSSELHNKKVIFRGRAVKFSRNIMGKNWIHIRDGSGNPSAGTNDILVTTQDTLLEGDVVTIRGTLSKDKDFGAGYRYAVIVEEAHITE